MTVLVITGTDTGVGKTVVTAAIAALATDAGHRVAVVKPAQTGVVAGEPGDVDVVKALAGDVTAMELRRYPEPLAPDTAARRAGMDAVNPAEVADTVSKVDAEHDLVLVEGAGGLLVRYDEHGGTLADVAWSLGAPVIVVARAGLGTLNATALTAEVAERRGLDVAGVIVGSWPAAPGLADRTNLVDLPTAAGAPLLGVLDEDVGDADRPTFLQAAKRGLAPWFGGSFDADAFAVAHGRA